MNKLLQLGTVTGLDTLSAGLKSRIEAKALGPPRSFPKWAEQILVDHPEGKALVLPAGTLIDGDFELDYEGLAEQAITTIAVLGDLTVKGRLINLDSDGGPFLFVDGNLDARQIEKGGASIVVFGSVKCRDLLFCDYNHGAFLAAGDVSASAIILCDQELHAGGNISGLIVSEELGNMREHLVPEVFADPDDAEDEFADGSLIRELLEQGLPVLKV